MSRKVAIVGSRGYQQLAVVRRFIYALPITTVIVSGGAAGVDRFAESVARDRGMTVVSIPINTAGLPPRSSAGYHLAFTLRAYARNRGIIEIADEVVAFWDGRSGGTKYTIREARKAGVPVRVFWANGIE